MKFSLILTAVLSASFTIAVPRSAHSRRHGLLARAKGPSGTGESHGGGEHPDPVRGRPGAQEHGTEMTHDQVVRLVNKPPDFPIVRLPEFKLTEEEKTPSKGESDVFIHKGTVEEADGETHGDARLKVRVIQGESEGHMAYARAESAVFEEAVYTRPRALSPHPRTLPRRTKALNKFVYYMDKIRSLKPSMLKRRTTLEDPAVESAGYPIPPAQVHLRGRSMSSFSGESDDASIKSESDDASIRSDQSVLDLSFEDNREDPSHGRQSAEFGPVPKPGEPASKIPRKSTPQQLAAKKSLSDAANADKFEPLDPIDHKLNDWKTRTVVEGFVRAETAGLLHTHNVQNNQKRDASDDMTSDEGSTDNSPSSKAAMDKNQADFQNILLAFQSAQANASALLFPLLDQMVAGSNSSMVYDAAWSIYSELTYQPMHIVGPFTYGMNCMDWLEEQMLGTNSSANATLTRLLDAPTSTDRNSTKDLPSDDELAILEYLATHEVLLQLYNNVWDQATKALNGTGLLDQMATLSGYLLPNDTSVATSGFFDQTAQDPNAAYFTDYSHGGAVANQTLGKRYWG